MTAKPGTIDYICDLPGGIGSVYVESLDDGGSIYYTDESGEITPFWNTEEVSRATLMLAMATDECRLHNLLKEILDSA